MLLYHGTSHSSAILCLKEGIKPRGVLKRSRGNWGHTISSNSKAVYLTNSYAVYFANAASRGSDKLAILEVDTDLLGLYGSMCLVPDEDAIEQSGRGRDGVPGDIVKRTAFFRRRLSGYFGTDQWELSLELLGNCAFLGTIPPKAISRMAVIDIKKAIEFCMVAIDPVIVIKNQKIVGAKYRAITRWLFDGNSCLDEAEATLSDFDKFINGNVFPWLRGLSREGIDVVDINKPDFDVAFVGRALIK